MRLVKTHHGFRPHPPAGCWALSRSANPQAARRHVRARRRLPAPPEAASTDASYVAVITGDASFYGQRGPRLHVLSAVTMKRAANSVGKASVI